MHQNTPFSCRRLNFWGREEAWPLPRPVSQRHPLSHRAYGTSARAPLAFDPCPFTKSYLRHCFVMDMPQMLLRVKSCLRKRSWTDWSVEVCAAEADNSGGRLPVNIRHARHATRLLHFAWVVDDAKCIVVTRVCVCVCVSVCLSVCLSVRGRTPTILHGSGCNLGAW